MVTRPASACPLASVEIIAGMGAPDMHPPAPSGAPDDPWREFTHFLTERPIPPRQQPHGLRWARQFVRFRAQRPPAQHSGREPAGFLRHLAAEQGMAPWQLEQARAAVEAFLRFEGAQASPREVDPPPGVPRRRPAAVAPEPAAVLERARAELRTRERSADGRARGDCVPGDGRVPGLPAGKGAAKDAPAVIRTRDLLLRRQLLYPLSYGGGCGAERGRRRPAFSVAEFSRRRKSAP